MKKLFTLCLALVASVGSIYADWFQSVVVGDFRYLLDEATMTAKITYRYREYVLGVTYYNLISGDKYWDIETANIPATIVYNEETYNVTGIGEHAFEHCDSLRSISIPSSVTTIDDYAFDKCNKLAAIHITDIAAWCQNDFKDNNPLAIAHNLYINDKLITDLIIPEGVTSIAEKAFYDCDNITSVIIPGSVTNIGKRAFSACSSLKSAIIGCCDNTTSETTNSYMNIESYAFYGNLDTVVIGQNVANIEERAFVISPSYSSLKSVTLYSDTIVSKTYSLNKGMEIIFGDRVQEYIIGEGVKSIGKYAFHGCIYMTSITLPKSLTKIDADAFSSSSYFSAVHVADLTLWCSVAFTPGNYYKTSNPLLSAHNLYLNGELVTDLVIPDGITCIGEWTFCGGSFNSVTIPSNVANIGQYAFYECTNLNAVHITDIASWCNIDFQNAYSQPLRYAHNLYLNKELLMDIAIPESVASIKQFAFWGCGLNSITIPSNVTDIGQYAFYECTNLFSIDIPNNVTFIGRRAFQNCENLISVKLSDSITIINEACFAVCKRLTAISIPYSVMQIEADAFAYCDSLTRVSIPEGVMSVGWGAFSHTSLSSVTLPRSLTEVGRNVFANCNKLEYVILLAETPPTPVFTDHFANFVPYEVPIYIPCGTMDTYMATDWRVYNIQYMPNIYELNVSSSDTLKGQVNMLGNSCENILSAIPNVGNYFVQWSDGNTENPRHITLTQDTTITAIFATQTFTVTFVNYNGNSLSSQEYEYGTMPVYNGTTPTRTADEEFTYTFNGWTPEIIPVVEDATYTATYTATKKTEAIDVITDNSLLPIKYLDNGNVYILMPDGKKYSILGKFVK